MSIEPRQHRELTVDDLIRLLETYDGHTIVRLASQPSWPFEYSLAGVTSAGNVLGIPGDDETDDAGDPLVDIGEDNVIYLVEGRQLGYLFSKDVFECMER